MDFENYLAENALLINDQLDQILSNFLNQIRKEKPKLTPFALGLINSCKGGKRIRGVLARLGYEIAGGFPNEDILKIAAALEILHSSILIHDDIMDQSPTRRGRPSLYKALGGGHYGQSQAITLGDIGLFLPIQIIATSQFPDEFKNKALSYLSQTIVDTGWGQIMDVEITQLSYTSGESKPTPEVIKFINLNKTAKYTIAGPMQLGAILAGADEQLLGLLGLFGENLGIAFQIKDDILDGETSSQDYTKALDYISKGKKIIPKLTKDNKMSKLLIQMAEYLVERQK